MLQKFKSSNKLLFSVNFIYSNILLTIPILFKVSTPNTFNFKFEHPSINTIKGRFRNVVFLCEIKNK